MTTLRTKLAELTDEDQRLLVEAAAHALNDGEFSKEVAELAGIDHAALALEGGFADRVVMPLFDLARAEDAAAPRN